MPEERNIFERRPGLTIIIFLFILFLFLDFIAGLFLIKEDYQSFRVQHYYYHHGLRPNHQAFARWSVNIYPFNTNSLGFRDFQPRKISLKKNQRRILFLGDSHTEGVDLPFESTFTGLLATKAEQHNTEILSAAAVSYSPRIHYLITEFFIEKRKLECDEIYVFIDISDIQNELVYEKYYPGKYNVLTRLFYNTRNFFFRNSFIFHSVKKIVTERGKEKFYNRIAGGKQEEKKISETFSADLYYSFFTHFDDNILLANPRFHGVGDWLYDREFKTLAMKGIQLGQENIARLNEICRKHGIRLTIAVQPWHSQIKMRKTVDEYVESWMKFAEKNDIGFINLYPLFINEENPQAVIKKYYIKNDNHWNREGHQKVARYLEKIIWN
jgi:lysophospholipase L1-like esterase